MAEEALSRHIGPATDTAVTPFSLRLALFNNDTINNSFNAMNPPPLLEETPIHQMSLSRLLFHVLIEEGGRF